MSWHEHAACKGVGPAAFFPSIAGHEGRQAARHAIARWCDRCSVREQCAAEGENEHGVWGGRLPVGMSQLTVRMHRTPSERLYLGQNAKRMHDAGMPAQEIAHLLGVTRRTVYKLIGLVNEEDVA